MNSEFYSNSNSNTISFVYAYLIFFIALLVNEKIKVGRILGFYSKISYSFFLNNGVGIEFTSVFYPLIGFSASLPIAFFALTIISYISWRYVEQPFRRFARNLVFHNPKNL